MLQGMMPGPQGGPPPGPDMGPPMPPPDQMGPPMEEPMEEMTDLPESAQVLAIEGNDVVLQTDDGERRRVPMDAFPVVPTEGMIMVQAIVMEITPEMVIVDVGGEMVDFPADNANFEVGEYVWVPELPTSPDQLQL